MPYDLTSATLTLRLLSLKGEVLFLPLVLLLLMVLMTLLAAVRGALKMSHYQHPEQRWRRSIPPPRRVTAEVAEHSPVGARGWTLAVARPAQSQRFEVLPDVRGCG